MKAVIVYESVYGNTHEVAEAVAEGLREAGEVEVRSVGEAETELVEAADILVVGGPTHIHGMASKMSLKAAAEDAQKHPEIHLEPESGVVLKEWLKQLPRGEQTSAAAFDTRMGKPAVLTGAASKRIARLLRSHGFELVAKPESFIVESSPGTPLVAGELDRARAWGRDLAAAAGGSAG
jgi:Flavodoxin